jgi:hypothetical protein
MEFFWVGIIPKEGDISQKKTGLDDCLTRLCTELTSATASTPRSKTN